MFTIVAFPSAYTEDVNFHIVRVSDGAIVGSIDEEVVQEFGTILGMVGIDYYSEQLDLPVIDQIHIPFKEEA